MNAAAVCPLDAALALGEPMLAAARAGEWSRVSLYQEQCDALLRSAFPVNDAAHGRLRCMQEFIQTVHSLTLVAREVSASQLGLHRQNHRALSAYLQLSDGR